MDISKRLATAAAVRGTERGGELCNFLPVRDGGERCSSVRARQCDEAQLFTLGGTASGGYPA